MFDKNTSQTLVSEELRCALTNAVRPIALAARETLFTEYDEGDALYFILEGRLELSIIMDDGRKLGFDVLSAGAVFGEIALLDPGPRTATATALEQSQLLMLDHSDLHQLLEQNPHLTIELLRLVGKRMRHITDQLNEYILLPLPKRLARKVLRLASRTDMDMDNPRLKLSHSELADLVGASREAVSKALSAWKKEGLLQTGRGSIELLNEEKLRDIAGL
ncbi:MAG: Crp/Fnr family transcriptional regulator [Pseudomonadota bacterium]